MKIASTKTLNNSRKTRFAYAYRAIERESMSEDIELQVQADDAMDRLSKLTKTELMFWAIREQEFKSLQ